MDNFIPNIRKVLGSYAIYMCLLLFFTNTLICDDWNEYFFSQDEYQHYMNLAKEINPEAHSRLRLCKLAMGKECIAKAVTSEPEVFNEEKSGYPVILLESLLHYDDAEQRRILQYYLEWYNDTEIIPPIAPHEQMKIMEVIKSIDPTAYEAITSADPTGSHIQRDYNGYGAFTFPSKIDGLPVILIEEYVTKLPPKELFFLIAHELAHYVLGHFTELHKDSYRTKADEELLANAFNRVQENEADRMAILNFGADIDGGIALMNRWILENKEHELKLPHKETFKGTHPLGVARIQHLESLRRDIDIYGVQRKSFNWRELAQHYLKNY